jgi:hypothetical protein
LLAKQGSVGDGNEGPLAVFAGVAGPRAGVLQDKGVGVLETLEYGAVRRQVGGVGVQAVGSAGKLAVVLLRTSIIKFPVPRQY